MPSERVQRQIDRLLDEAEQAIAARDWALVDARCEAALRLDPGNQDASVYLAAARREPEQRTADVDDEAAADSPPAPPLPASFAGGRYQVLGLLGEGGRKVAYRAHDTMLDRDVALSLVKTDALDADGRERVKREAQALGRLGSHPNIVLIHDLGEDGGRPYFVTELLPSDLDHEIAAAPDRRLPLSRVLAVSIALSNALAYAHSKGVIHRDLKPSNVFLTEDGTPRLGDFGLAMWVADPRLTQAGMMVGTAVYMAPELATGGDVTSRSDLYSLGCLLYELVTGRPPFVGDASIAIIGQHLHANPVAPSWHRPDCPTALEALILRLLEKDPQQRPATAGDIAEALASISLSAKRTTSESQRQLAQSGPNPVYQRAFVGREQELRQLEAAFDAAVSGQGGLVMVVGEPGIGKTTLTEQLATYAGLRGGRVLVGHCYEEGSLSLAYLPFVEAIRSYVLDHDVVQLKGELGAAAPEVARILSDVRERVQVAPAESSGDGAEDRYRLLQGVSSFLRNAGQTQPLVLVLEDLHDADRGTLDLLQFLARQLAGARLLIVGTYRDVEVDRQHPLSATLAELRRAANFSRVLLRGLTADEVQRMLSAITGQAVRWSLAEAVHRQTEGNPLFVQEVIRYLAEEGHIKRAGGRWQPAGDTPLLQTIPEGLRDVIGKRLSRLTIECNRLLAVAAVIGRDFQLRTVVSVSGGVEERVTALLDEAVKVAVLQEQAKLGAVRYRFAHAFFRQTLYDELSAARRIRLHQQVAVALEQQYADRLEEHAAELAEHFTYSSTPADLTKAVAYGAVAAARATTVYAYGEAARLLTQALEVQEVLDAGDIGERCDLLLKLCDALVPVGEHRRVLEELLPEAFQLAEAAGDHVRAARAADRWVLFGPRNREEGTSLYSPEREAWVARLDHHAQPQTVERVHADLRVAETLRGQGRLVEAAQRLQATLIAARDLHDPDTLFMAIGAAVNFPLPATWAETARLALECAVLPRTGVTPTVLQSMLRVLHFRVLDAGDRRLAEELAAEQARLAERTGDAYSAIEALTYQAQHATVDGRFDEALAFAERARALGAERDLAGFAQMTAGMPAIRALLYTGQAEAAYRLASSMVNATSFRWPMLALAHAGPSRAAEAQHLLAQLPLDTDLGETVAAPGPIQCLETALLLGERDWVRRAAKTLEPFAPSCTGLVTLVTPARLLGAAAVLLGDRVRARAYYQQALEAAGKVRFRPEIALTRLALAELQASEDDAAATTVEHLAFAIDEFEAMGMQPALARAMTLSDRLTTPPASDAVTPAPGVEVSDTAPAAPDAIAAPVFISYSSADRPTAFALADRLLEEGVAVWIDRRSIPAGESWDAEIVKGIRASGLVAVLVSPQAMTSKNVRQELRLALQYDKPVLPLLLQPTTYPGEVEYVLAGRQWVEVLDQSAADWFPHVLAAVRRLA